MPENVFNLTFDTVFASQTATQPNRSVEISRNTEIIELVISPPNRGVEASRQTQFVILLISPPGRGIEARRDIVGLESQWQIDGTPVETVTSEITESGLLAVTLRVSSETLKTILRPLKSDEGQVNTLMTDDGGFVAIDRADGSNSYNITPRIRRYPLRQSGVYHVERYEEELVSQSVEEWDVEIDFVPAENRDDTRSIDETPATDEWGFSTRYGQIATDRVDAEFAGRGEGGVRRFDLAARLTFEQSLVFESALSRLGGVRVREIPDATNQAVDETDDHAATITVNSPTEETVPSGQYSVVEWESERLNDAYQSVAVTLAEQ